MKNVLIIWTDMTRQFVDIFDILFSELLLEREGTSITR